MSHRLRDTTQKKIIWTNKSQGACDMCKKTYVRLTDWYKWFDVYISPGETLVEKMCSKCVIKEFGRKAYEERYKRK